MPSVYERVANVLVEECYIDQSRIKPDSLFTDDFMMDSLDMVNLLFALENEFTSDDIYLDISRNDAEMLINVQSVVDYLKGLGIEDN